MLKIKELSLHLNNKQILKNINIEFEENKLTAIIGKNASGKTSIVKCINNIYKYEGIIEYNNKDIKQYNNKEIAKEISILPQFLKYPHILVNELLIMARNPYLSLNMKLNKEDINIIEEIIKKLNINDLIDKYLDELSGGQKQIVFLAMQFVQDAKVMIFDEPSSFMDINFENEFLKLIKEKNNKTRMVVMHSINQVIKYADNIIIIDNGEIVFNGTNDQCINGKYIEKIFNLKKYQIENKILFDN